MEKRERMRVLIKKLGDSGARIVYGSRMDHPVFVRGKTRHVFSSISGDLSDVSVANVGYDDGECFLVITKDIAMHVHLVSHHEETKAPKFTVSLLPGSHDMYNAGFEKYDDDGFILPLYGECPFPEVESANP